MGYTLIGLGGGIAYAPTAGSFTPFGGASLPTNFQNATETAYQMPAPAAGIISGLRCDQGPFSGTFSAFLRKNGANAYQTFSSDKPVAFGSDSVARGDLIDLSFPAVATPSLWRIQATFQATSGHATLYAALANGSAAYTASTTAYLRLFATLGSATVLTTGAQVRAITAGVASRFYINIPLNAATASSTAGYNANGANGNQTVAIGAGLTGVFSDTTRSDTINVGDLLCAYLTVGAGGALGVYSAGVVFSNPTSAANDLYATGPTVTATVLYACLYGSGGTTFTTAASAQIAHGFAVTLSGLSAFVTSNATTSNSTVFLNKNGTSGPQGVVVGAGLTGWFLDTTNATSFTATDLACYAVAGGPSGALTVFWLGVSETAAPPPTPGGYSLIGVGTNNLAYFPTQGWSGPYAGSMPQSIVTSVTPQYITPFPFAATLTQTIGDPAVCTGTFSGQVFKNNGISNGWNSGGATGGSVAWLLGDAISMGWNGSGAYTVPRVTSILQSTFGAHGGFYASAGNTAVAAGSTVYPRFCSALAPLAAVGVKSDMRSGVAGTLQRLSINVLANATTAPSTFNTYKNDTTAGAQSIPIGAGLTGVFLDAAHTDALNAGDLFCGQLVVGAGGTLTPSVVAVGFVNTATQASDLYSAGPATTAASTNSFFCLIGNNSISGSPGFSVEAQANIAHGFGLVASNLAVSIATNATTATSTLVSRKNLANGNLSVAIGAGLTGWFTDTTNSDAVAATDGYCTLLTTGVGGNLTTWQIGVTETAPNAPWAVAVAETGAATDAATDAAIYANRVAETGAAADSVAATEVIASASVAELGDAEDTIISSRLFPQSVAEAGAAADTVVSVPIAFVATVHEAAAAADAATTTVAFADVAAERGTAADTAGTAAIFPRAVAEVGAAADTTASFSFYLAGVVAEVGDAEDTEPFAHVHGHLIVAEPGAAADAPSSSSVMPAGVTEAGAAVSNQAAHAALAPVVLEAAAAADTAFDFVGHLLPAGSMTLTGYAPTTPDAWWDLSGVPTIWTPLTPPPATHP